LPALAFPLETAESAFIPSIRVLNRLKEYYPCCRIKVQCPKGLKGLLPQWVIWVQQQDPRTRDLNYREFDLQIHKHKLKIQPIHYNRDSIEKIMLDCLQIAIMPDELKLPPLQVEHERNPEKTYIIDDPSATESELYLDLKTKFGDEHYGQIETPEFIELCKSAKYFIFTGFNPHVFIAAHLNIPAFIFLPKNALVKHENQLDRYPNINHTHILAKSDPGFDDIVGKLSQTINGGKADSAVSKGKAKAGKAKISRLNPFGKSGSDSQDQT